MKRRRILSLTLALLLSAGILISGAFRASASSGTAHTYVILSDGSWSRTQDAYLPSNVMMYAQELNQPEDLFVTDSALYIADTGNGRVLRVDWQTETAAVIGEGTLGSPSGLYVTGDGRLYVADRGQCRIYVFDESGSLLRTYDRPAEATFGSATQYIPSKIAVGADGLMYVVSSGSYDGMIKLSAEGKFLGYFGYNNNPTSLGDWIVDRFFTDEQKQSLLNKVPYSFRNLTMDAERMVYTVTMNAEGDAVKKHDVGGSNLFPEMYDELNFVDLAIGADNQIYAVTETGLIYEYDSEGNLLFSFGGMAASVEAVGLFTKVSAVDADSDGSLYVLDQERGLVHVFAPTAFAGTVHSALNAYNTGRYGESEGLWEQVRRISGSCQMVENGLGNCAFQRHDYETAAAFYKLAENRKGYSDSYWLLRSDQISALLPWLFAGIAVLLLLKFLYDHWLRDRLPERRIGRREENLRMVFGVLRHPVDTFESIRWMNRGDWLTATLVYLLVFVTFVCGYVLRGFVISTHNTRNTSLLFVSLIFVLPVVLFLGCNYLVGEINDSKARFRDLYIGLAYCGAPFLVFGPVSILLSHVVTLNESRLLNLADFAIYCWCFVLLIIFLKETHRYLLRTVFKNLGITIFLMAVVILAASLLGMFADQLVGFVTEIVKEVQSRGI